MKKLISVGILCLILFFSFSCKKQEATPQSSKETSKGVRSNKSGNINMTTLAIPNFIASTTGIIDQTRTGTIILSDPNDSNIIYEGTYKAKFDSNNKLVEAKVETRFLTDLGGDSNVLILGGFDELIMGSPCPCDVRRDYWYNKRIGACQQGISYADCVTDAKLSRLASAVADALFGWIGCSESDLPNGC